MTETVDARGLSCPQPVVAARKKMDELGHGVFQVIVDNGASRENVIRMAENQGWSIDVSEKEDDFLLTIKKA
jgi:tRNA 2-thiouridine synthesizing protein A